MMYQKIIKFKKVILSIILVIAAILRFWQLGNYPALNADEAAIGYNAYSLLETGKDEHGNSWPTHFQSFNDYKPGLYFYIVLPFVKLLGLNEWAVRIPNALLGVASVYLIYLLVEKLFSYRSQAAGLKEKTHHTLTRNTLTGLVAAFFLAISPWHIHFSRGGWEVNTATFFVLLGTYLFLKGFKNIVVLFFSVIVYALALYTYHAARIAVPLLGFGLIFIYLSEVRINYKNFLLAGLLGLVAVLPLVKDLTRPEIASRAAGVGLFADSGPLSRINEQRGEHINFTGPISKILHNKPVNYTLAFFDNWADHYHGLFLFLSGDDIERNKVPETGQMYMFDFFLVVIGLIWMAKNITKQNRLIFHWLLIAPVAAALTFQSPHALRSQNMVIPLVIIVAVGFTIVLENVSQMKSLRVAGYVLNNKYLKPACYLLLATVLVWQFARYEHLYWKHMTEEYPFSSQYGVKELFNYITEKEGEFDNVIVTTRYDQPYILFLFYGASAKIEKYHPSNFQANHILTPRDEFGFSTVSVYENLIFRPIDWENDRLLYPDSLIAGTPEDIYQEANIVKRIYGLNGYEYFDVVAN